MKVKYGSSFLRDIQRIDSIINLSSCNVEYTKIYDRREDTINVEAIYDKVNKKIKVYFETQTCILIPGDDPTFKVYVKSIDFYYSVVGGGEGYPELAFRLEGEDTGQESETDIILDSYRNLFEFDLRFFVKVGNGFSITGNGGKCIIGNRYFKYLSIGDTISTGISDVEIYTYENKNITSLDETGKAYVSPKDVNENVEIIKSRGLIVVGRRVSFNLYIKYDNPLKAVLESDYNTNDTKFLQSIGINPGTSLFKDIKISDTDLVWVDSYYKYTSREGLKQSSDIYSFENYSGQLEARREIVRSFSNIVIDKGSWENETRIEPRIEVVEKLFGELYLNNKVVISSLTFNEYNSPLQDSESVGSAEESCSKNLGIFLNPGELVYGNTNYLLYTIFPNISKIVVYGTPGSSLEFLFNKSSINGSYSSHTLDISEDGIGTLENIDLSFYHLNGIKVINPGIFSKIEFYFLFSNRVFDYVPIEDMIEVHVSTDGELLRIRGYCEYTDYEKYMGTYREMSKGAVSITSAPEVSINIVENLEVDLNINDPWREVLVKKVGYTSSLSPYAILNLRVKNNKIIENNKITYNNLESKLKLKIKQQSLGIIWKLISDADYTEDGVGLFILEYTKSSIKSGGSDRMNVREIKLFTNIITSGDDSDLENLISNLSFDSSSSDNYAKLFGNSGSFYPYLGNVTDPDIEAPFISSRIKAEFGTDEEEIPGVIVTLYTLTRSMNNTNRWRPSTVEDRDTPCIVNVFYSNEGNIYKLSNCSFYLVQRPMIASYEIWENIYGDSFSPVIDNRITLYPTTGPSPEYKKDFVVIRNGDSSSNIWYHIKNNNIKYIILSEGLETNRGVSLQRPETSIVELDRQADKDKIRTIKSKDVPDISLGMLTVSGVSYVSNDWRESVVTDTAYANVFKSTVTISLLVGSDEEHLRPEDYEIVATKIYAYNVCIKANHTFVVSTFGDAFIIDSDGSTLVKSFNQFVTEGEEKTVNIKIALKKFDETMDFSTSWGIVYCGNISRRITIRKGSVETYHNYLVKEDRIVIVGNGALSPFLSYGFTSSTTPTITAETVTIPSITEDDIVPIYSNFQYNHHDCGISIVIPSYSSVSNKRYPVPNVGRLIEKSKSYSNRETIGIGAPGETIGPLETQIFVKGLDHYLWYSDSITDFSAIELTNVPTRKIVRLSPGQTSGTFYIVSRYNNATFSNYIPPDTTLQRGEYIATVDFKNWAAKSTPDDRTQIQYYIPVDTTLNQPNTGGNIYLGKLTLQAITDIADGRELDILDVTPQFISEVGINAAFIESKIISDVVRPLELVLYVGGLNDSIFRNINNLDEWYDVFAHSGEIIFEVGNKVSNIEVTSSSYSPNLIVEYDNEINILTYSLSRRLGQGFWASSDSFDQIMYEYCQNIEGMYITYSFRYFVEGVLNTYTMNTTCWQYGYNHGLTCKCISGDVYEDRTRYFGIGGVNQEGQIEYTNSIEYTVSSDGGVVTFNMGTVWLKDGIPSSGVSVVIPTYTISGGVTEDWSSGTMSSSNLKLTFDPNLDNYEKTYIIEMSTGYQYYPTCLKVMIHQEANTYGFSFVTDRIDVYSTSIIYGGDKTYVNTNFTEEMFDAVTYSLSGTVDTSQLVLEKNYNERWIKFSFLPNYSGQVLQGVITAYLPTGYGTAEINVKQGCFAYFVRTLYLDTWYKYSSRKTSEIKEERDIRPSYIIRTQYEAADYQYSSDGYILGYEYRNVDPSGGLDGYDELWVHPTVVQNGVLATVSITYGDNGQEEKESLIGYGGEGGTTYKHTIDPTRNIAKIHIDLSNIFKVDFTIISLIKYVYVDEWTETLDPNYGIHLGSTTQVYPVESGSIVDLGTFTTPSYTNNSDGSPRPNFKDHGYHRVVICPQSIYTIEPPNYNSEEQSISNIGVSGDWRNITGSGFNDRNTHLVTSDPDVYYNNYTPFIESSYEAVDPSSTAGAEIEVTSNITNNITSTPTDFKFTYSIIKASSSS